MRRLRRVLSDTTHSCFEVVHLNRWDHAAVDSHSLLPLLLAAELHLQRKEGVFADIWQAARQEAAELAELGVAEDEEREL